MMYYKSDMAKKENECKSIHLDSPFLQAKKPLSAGLRHLNRYALIFFNLVSIDL
jgi:hypothetical protein